MSKYIHDRYVRQGIIDYIDDVVLLIARVLILYSSLLIVGYFIWVYLSEPANLAFIPFIIVLAVILLSHFLVNKINPHLFHPPKLAKQSPPLYERVRASWTYRFGASIYVSYMFTSLINTIPTIQINTNFHSFIRSNVTVLTYFTSTTFLCILCLAISMISISMLKGKNIMNALYGERICNGRDKWRLLSRDVVLLSSLVMIYFVWFYRQDSIYVNMYQLGIMLLGSSTFLAVKDIFIGHWTHTIEKS